MNNLPLDMRSDELLKYLRDPSGISELLIETNTETGDSPAMIVADVINVIRADTKMLAEQHGVEVQIKMMTPERAAELLAGVVAGNSVELLVVFNDLADKRDQILREAMDDDEYETFLEQKHSIMHTEPDK